MPKYLPQILIGVAASFVMGFLIRAFVFHNIIAPTLYGAGTGVFVAYILANLAGNKRVPNASDAAKAAALKLTPPAGMALLVVYREGFVAKLAGLNLAIDGREFAQLTSPKFTALALAPGSHTLAAAFGGLAGAQSKAASHDFQAEAGAVTAVRINARMGMVQGAVKFTPETDLAAVQMKLANMPMVAAAA
jgi:hypothetical protein